MRTTGNRITSFIKTSCQFIHSFFASNTERNMRITCAVWMLSLFNKFRTYHNLKTSSVLKSYEVRSKICCWIMVTVIAFPFRKVTKKFFAFYKSFTYSATCSIFILKILYHSSRKKVPLIAVRSSRTSYRFHSLQSSSSQHSVFRKGSKQSVHSFSFTSLHFIRSHTVCIY